MRFVGRGHGAVRATHDKSIELVAGSELTARGTCIVGVSTVTEPAAPMAGPVRVTISAGSSSFGIEAVANPSWVPGGPVVIRRSPLRLPGTFATEASAASSDLPRELVAALQDPGTEVIVDVESVRTDVATVVLFLADPSSAAAGAPGSPTTVDPRLLAELAVADTVLADDAEALRLIGRHAARTGSRTLVVATRDLPGRSGLGALADAGRIETVGLPASLAVAAASPGAGPVTFSGAADDARGLIGRAPSSHRVVVAVRAGELADLLELAGALRGTTHATIAQEHAPPVRVVDGIVPALPTRDTIHVCLPASGKSSLDPSVRSAIAELLADGVPTKAAARVLATLTGWDRRRAYDTVLAWRA